MKLAHFLMTIGLYLFGVHTELKILYVVSLLKKDELNLHKQRSCT